MSVNGAGCAGQKEDCMKVSTKGRYALRLMIDLGMHGIDKFVSLKDVSRRQHISIKYLEQIVTPLNHAGLLRSARGAQGGYHLARKPEEYTAGQILRAIEGSMAPIVCLEYEPNECEYYSQCATVEFWEGMKRVIDEYIDGVTLEQLVESYKKRLERCGDQIVE